MVVDVLQGPLGLTNLLSSALDEAQVLQACHLEFCHYFLVTLSLAVLYFELYAVLNSLGLWIFYFEVFRLMELIYSEEKLTSIYIKSTTNNYTKTLTNNQTGYDHVFH